MCIAISTGSASCRPGLCKNAKKFYLLSRERHSPRESVYELDLFFHTAARVPPL